MCTPNLNSLALIVRMPSPKSQALIVSRSQRSSGQTETTDNRRTWQIDSASAPDQEYTDSSSHADQEYIYFMESETLPSTCYILSSETLPSACCILSDESSNGYDNNIIEGNAVGAVKISTFNIYKFVSLFK